MREFLGILLPTIVILILVFIAFLLLICLYLICRETGCNRYCNKAGTCSGAENCRAKSSFDALCFEPRINIFKKFINRKRD